MNYIQAKLKSLALASILMLASFGSTNSYANNNCLAKFTFVNVWTAANNGDQCEIKVKKVSISGDKGSWDENITNKKINYG